MFSAILNVWIKATYDDLTCKMLFMFKAIWLAFFKSSVAHRINSLVLTHIGRIPSFNWWSSEKSIFLNGFLYSILFVLVAIDLYASNWIVLQNWVIIWCCCWSFSMLFDRCAFELVCELLYVLVCDVLNSSDICFGWCVHDDVCVLVCCSLALYCLPFSLHLFWWIIYISIFRFVFAFFRQHQSHTDVSSSPN